MTDVQLTQVVSEEWIAATAPAQVTQVAIEEWTSVALYVPPPTVALSASRAGIGSVFSTLETTLRTVNVADVGTVTYGTVPPAFIPAYISAQVSDRSSANFYVRPFVSGLPAYATITVRSSVNLNTSTRPPIRSYALSASRAGIGSVVLTGQETGTYNIADVGVINAAPLVIVPPTYVYTFSRVTARSSARSRPIAVTPVFVSIRATITDRSYGRPRLTIPLPTSVQLTQAVAEHWFTTTAPAQVTQVAIEEWTSVALGSGLSTRVTGRSSVRPLLIVPPAVAGDGWLWVNT